VTATRVLLVIDLLIQVVLPVMVMFSHSHIFPHVCSTSRNVNGDSGGLARGAIESKRQCPDALSIQHVVCCAIGCVNIGTCLVYTQ
jgi:hypothetical protein